ncbi:Sensor histidine kinase [Pseudomonas savastanoi pv. phaseolicola]|nr:Sensor histidine kinase [Pseudomonas savastanoi pv. phaseolicola]
MRLHRPVQALALGMKQLDPESLSQRLPVQYDQEELKRHCLRYKRTSGTGRAIHGPGTRPSRSGQS